MKLFLLCMGAFVPLLAQTDYQVRQLVHIQAVPEGKMLGFASWGVMSDVTKTAPFKSWAVAGIVMKKKSRWLEVMVGAGHFYADAAASPVVDVRASDKSFKYIQLSCELFFPTRRFDFAPQVTTPLHIGKFRFSIRGEADIWWGKNPIKGGGPGLVIPLGKHFVLSPVYHFHTGVQRTYSAISFP